MGTIKQIGRFLVVGGSAFLVDYGVLWLLVELFGVNYLVASAFSFATSVIFNYIFSTLWVFDCAGSENKASSFFVFVALSIIGLFLNMGIMWLAVDVLEIYYLVSKAGSTGIVMIYNFVSRKFLFEKRQRYERYET